MKSVTVSSCAFIASAVAQTVQRSWPGARALKVAAAGALEAADCEEDVGATELVAGVEDEAEEPATAGVDAADTDAMELAALPVLDADTAVGATAPQAASRAVPAAMAAEVDVVRSNARRLRPR